MWESSVSAGCLVMYVVWTAAFGLIVAGWLLGSLELQNLGLALSALAAALTVMRDNQRTRRMLRRPGEAVAPLRRR